MTGSFNPANQAAFISPGPSPQHLEPVRDSFINCDLCEVRGAHQDIYQLDDSLNLCSYCLKTLKTRPGRIEEAVRQFLLGNVL
ncbi:MAG: hypothetical protein HQK60_11810 [Deltaproteobacteria bacterium]|nr:hypothetical protein [Deltaproteobacteria bacterium]